VRFKRPTRIALNVKPAEEVRLKKCSVLVTGAAAPGFVSIVKALRASTTYKMKLIGSDYVETLSSNEYVEESFVLPDNRSPEFAEALLDLCVKMSIDVVLPIRTDDQLPICRKLADFRKAGVEPAIVTTDPDLLDSLLNKRKLMEYCNEVIGLETPKFLYSEHKNGLRDAVERLGYPDVPVAIKPSYSMGSRGLRILDEKIDRRKRFFDEKPSGIYSTLDDVLAIIGDDFPEIIAMEYLPGNEYTVDALCRKGQTFAVIPRLRKRLTGGITTSGVVVKDHNYESIRNSVEQIVEGFGLSFNVGTQFRESSSGIPLLLEVNPRLQGTTTMSVAAGVNIPELMVQMALQEFDYDFKPKIKWGLEMHRVWLEIFKDDKQVWKNE
ncbi:MAG: ATP-grasp domain-containing protein, partial [Candidatus Thorarchaeota archaeon]